MAEPGDRQGLSSPSCELILSLLELRLDSDTWSALLPLSGSSDPLGVQLLGSGATFMTYGGPLRVFPGSEANGDGVEPPGVLPPGLGS